MVYRRSSSVFRAILLAGLLAVTVIQLPAHAACAAPQLTVENGSPRPGETVTILGEFFAAECNDTATGCSGPRPSPPSRNIDVQLRRGSDVVASTVVDANEDYEFIVQLPLPDDAAPGEYRVVAVEDRPYTQEWDSEPFVVPTPD